MIKPIEYRVAEYDDGHFHCEVKTPLRDWKSMSVQYTLDAAKTWIDNHKEPKVPKIVKVYEVE